MEARARYAYKSKQEVLERIAAIDHELTELKKIPRPRVNDEVRRQKRNLRSYRYYLHTLVSNFDD